MAKEMTVLLVLTGHHQDMRSSAPTFEAIPDTEIVSQRAQNIIEVPLKIATRYLRYLERREEAENEEFHARNAQRKGAIHADIVDYAKRSVAELARQSQGPFVPSRPGVVLGGLMHEAWERLVDDERYFEMLEDSKNSRPTG